MNIFRLAAALPLLLCAGLWAASSHPGVRIATPWPAQNTVVAMLGYGDSIVGTSMIAKAIPLFRQSVPGIAQVPAISASGGSELNAEQVIALGANLLFVADSGTELPRQALLAQAGVKVVSFRANAMAALVQRVQQTADVLGPDARQKAQRYRRYFERNVALVARGLKGLPTSGRIRLYHSMGNPLMTSGRPSLNQDWMDLAGAANVAEHWFDSRPGRSGDVAAEQVIAANPQVIVAMNRRDADSILASPQWTSVDAVRHHRVYVNPKGMFWWCRETSEEALQFLWLAKTLYPGRFKDVDMRAETRDFYRQFFNLSLSDRQLDDILNPPQ